MLPAICIALVVVIAIAAIPREVWSLFLENSIDHRGRLRLRHAWREICRTNGFLAGFMLSLIVLTSLLISATIVLDARSRLSEKFDRWFDSETIASTDWNALISVKSADVASAMSRLPLTAAPSPSVDSRRVLWSGMFVAAAIVLAGMTLVARLTSRGYNLSMDQMVIELPAKNRQRIANRYLRTTAQRDARWHRLEDRNRDGADPKGSQQNA